MTPGCSLERGHLGPHGDGALVCVPRRRLCVPHSGGAALVIVSEAAGMKLHLSEKSATGYEGVFARPTMSGCSWQARAGRRGNETYLGTFESAVAAAVAYAKHIAAQEEESEKREVESKERGEGAQRLPHGWTREERVRAEGASAGTRDCYYYSPAGKQFRSMREVLEHLDEEEKEGQEAPHASLVSKVGGAAGVCYTLDDPLYHVPVVCTRLLWRELGIAATLHGSFYLLVIPRRHPRLVALPPPRRSPAASLVRPSTSS